MEDSLKLDDLPVEVLSHITTILVTTVEDGECPSRAAAQTLCRLREVCRLLRDIASSDVLWRKVACDDPYWRLHPLPTTDEEYKQRLRYLRIPMKPTEQLAGFLPRALPTKKTWPQNAPRVPKMKKAVSIFDEDEEGSVVEKREDPRRLPLLHVPDSYFKLYAWMPPPPALYTETRWLEDAIRMANLVVHGMTIRTLDAKVKAPSSLFGSDDEEESLFGPIVRRPSSSLKLKVLNALWGKKPQIEDIVCAQPSRLEEDQRGVWFLVRTHKGVYYNVGPPSLVTLKQWHGGLRDRFIELKRQQRIQRQQHFAIGLVDPAESAEVDAEEEDTADYRDLSGRSLFDDDGVSWCIKSWESGKMCTPQYIDYANRESKPYRWNPMLASKLGWSHGHYLSPPASSGNLLRYFHVIRGIVQSSWSIDYSGRVVEAFCRVKFQSFTPQAVFESNAKAQLPGGEKVMTYEQFLVGLSEWQVGLWGGDGVYMKYDPHLGYPHVQSYMVFRFGENDPYTNRNFELHPEKGTKLAPK